MAIVDVGDDPRDQVPLRGFKRDLHEPLLRRLWQLLRAQLRAAPGRRRRAARAGSGAAPRAPAREPGRRWAWAGLAVVLAGGLALRLWGIRQGLPFAYNTDEGDHFVPHAVRMFEEGTLNPHYFANPPAFTYLLHYLFDAWYGGVAGGVVHAYAAHPDELYTLARVAAALLGDARAVAALPRRRAAVRPRRRAAGGRDRGGRLPARLLLAPGAQRRARRSRR